MGSGTGMGPGWMGLLWFFVVIAAIPLVLWLLRRGPLAGMAGMGGSGAAAARTVGVLALSPAQRVVTVEVGQGEQRCWLVLGVTAQSITTLHTMAPQEPPAAAQAPAGGFAAVLQRMRQPAAPPAGPGAA
jgi:flagellar protein FliO/FliZ